MPGRIAEGGCEQQQICTALHAALAALRRGCRQGQGEQPKDSSSEALHAAEPEELAEPAEQAEQAEPAAVGDEADLEAGPSALTCSGQPRQARMPTACGGHVRSGGRAVIPQPGGRR